MFFSAIRRYLWPCSFIWMSVMDASACGGAVSPTSDSGSGSGNGGTAGTAGGSAGGGGSSSGGAGSHPSDSGPGDSSITSVPCPVAHGFTGCVSSCGDTAEKVPMAASCVDGHLACAPPRIPAASCPMGSWPTGSHAGCGPWVDGYNCQCTAVCTDGLWDCLCG